MLISLCIFINTPLSMLCTYQASSPHFFLIASELSPSNHHAGPIEATKKYNYSNATLNTQIPHPICGKSFKQQEFKKHKASCKTQGEAEKDHVHAGQHYEQTLNGKWYWYHCCIIAPNSYNYVLNLEQLLLNTKCRHPNSVDDPNNTAAYPVLSHSSLTAKLSPVNANEFDAQALNDYEGNVFFLFHEVVNVTLRLTSTIVILDVPAAFKPESCNLPHSPD